MSIENNDSNKKNNNKKLAVIIAVAAVLVICVALAVLLGKNSGKQTDSNAKTTSQTTQATSLTTETTAPKMDIGKATEKKINGNSYVLAGKSVGTEGDIYIMSFKDGKAELYEEIMDEQNSFTADYTVEDDGVHVTLDTTNFKNDSYVFQDTGKSRYIKYTESAKGFGTDTDIAIVKADYDNESRFDIVSELDGKSFDSEYFAKTLNISNTVNISFNKDAEYADDVLLATVDRFNGEYNINCKGINDNLLYCDMYLYGDGEPTRYKFCIEKTDDGYQQIVTDGNGMHFYDIEIK